MSPLWTVFLFTVVQIYSILCSSNTTEHGDHEDPIMTPEGVNASVETVNSVSNYTKLFAAAIRNFMSFRNNITHENPEHPHGNHSSFNSSNKANLTAEESALPTTLEGTAYLIMEMMGAAIGLSWGVYSTISNAISSYFYGN